VGTLTEIASAPAMTGYLRRHGRRIFDYHAYADRFRQEVRNCAIEAARRSGLDIEWLSSPGRRDERVRELMARRSAQPGMVGIFAAMHLAASFKPWHHKPSGKDHIKTTHAEHPHYYYCLLDPDFGLCWLRVSSWLPCSLEFRCDVGAHLRHRLALAGLACPADPDAEGLPDLPRAQEIADRIDIESLHRYLDRLAAAYCSVAKPLGLAYHWTLGEVSYASDLVCTSAADCRIHWQRRLQASATRMTPGRMDMLLGRKPRRQDDEPLPGCYTRVQGRRITHHLGPLAIMAYPTHGAVFRVETTCADPSFLKESRPQTPKERRPTPMTGLDKSIDGLKSLAGHLRATNWRYLEYLAAIEPQPLGIELNRSTMGA
jgi:hypothetical protein